jgi:hypothetical protein
MVEVSMATSIQVVFDCTDPGRQAKFWAEALHYRMPEPPGASATWEEWARAEGIPEDHWNDAAAIEDSAGLAPRLFFQKVPEGKVTKNRVHLDLNVSGGPGVPLEVRKIQIIAEVDRLKALGADDHRGAIDQGGEFWVRMNDPEGNEFCVQ